jgi:hypothetical protein
MHLNTQRRPEVLEAKQYEHEGTEEPAPVSQPPSDDHYPVAFPLIYAPTFKEIVQCLHYCPVFKRTFAKQGNFMKRIGPIYYLVEHDWEVYTDP